MTQGSKGVLPPTMPTNCSAAKQLPQFCKHSKFADLLRKSLLSHVWRVPRLKALSCKHERLLTFWPWRHQNIFLTIHQNKCILEKDMCTRWKNAADAGSQSYPGKVPKREPARGDESRQRRRTCRRHCCIRTVRRRTEQETRRMKKWVRSLESVFWEQQEW